MKLRFLFFIFILAWPIFSCGLSFTLPKTNSLIGEPKATQVKPGEDFSDVAIRFGVGYYEIFEANPGVNPDKPPVNTVLIIPTQYILPDLLKENVVVINLAEMRLYYQSVNNNKVYIFPIGIGKEDWATPLGEMSIVEKIKNPTWMVPESIYKFRKSIGKEIKRMVPPGPDNPLGKYALRLSNRKYLIHGNNVPAGVGRRSTAGCIRLYNDDIEKLYNLVDVGTKTIIINQPYKAALIGGKLYLEAHMPLFEQRVAIGDDMQSVYDVVSNATRGHKLKVNWQKIRKIAKEHLTVPRVVN